MSRALSIFVVVLLGGFCIAGVKLEWWLAVLLVTHPVTVLLEGR